MDLVMHVLNIREFESDKNSFSENDFVYYFSLCFSQKTGIE